MIKKNPNIIQLNLFPPRTGMDCLGRVLMLGGGVQSMAMVDMISVGKIPPVDLVIFADTTLEPWYVYQAIGWARSALVKVGIPLKVVKADCGTNHWAYEGGYGFQVRASMPYWTFSEEGKRGRLRRQCTPELKIAPNNRGLRYWLAEKGHIPLPSGWECSGGSLWWHGTRQSADEWPRLSVPQGTYVEMLYGISTDESIRATAKRGNSWQEPVYPLVEMKMSRNDCLSWMAENGFSIPRKSACVNCPYRDDSAWLAMKEEFPEEFERACRYDDLLRDPNWLQVSVKGAYSKIRNKLFTHQSGKPLRDVDFEALITARKRSQMSQFELEMVDGACRNDGGFSCIS